MNSRIEPEAGRQADSDQSSDDAFAELVQMMSASPVTLLIGPRNDATSRFAREAAIACAGLRVRPGDGKCGDLVVLFDQWSGDPLLALGDAIAAAVGSASGIPIAPPRSDRRTLADRLAHWADRFGANFTIVLDQYERNLAAEPLNGRNARFAEQLAEAIAQAAGHTRFLVVIGANSEAVLPRLTARLGGLCRNAVRLAGATEMRKEPPPQQGADAATSPTREPDEPLPEGFSALADEQIDTSATDSIVRRRQRRRAIARWRKLGVGAALAVAAALGVVLFQHLQAPDPGARLARALDPRSSPIAPAPSPASPAPATADSLAAPQPAAAGDTENPLQSLPEAGVPPAAPRAPAQQLAPPRATTPSATATVEPVAVRAAPASSPPPPVPGEKAPVALFEPALSPAPSLASQAKSAPPAAPKRGLAPPAFRIDAPPGPPLPAKLARAVANPKNEPMVFIHIRSESQRAQARSLASGLDQLNIVVSGIRLDESGPIRGDLRYYRKGERDEANYLARALGRLGAPGVRVTPVAGHEAAAVPRHYELWLPPPTR